MKAAPAFSFNVKKLFMLFFSLLLAGCATGGKDAPKTQIPDQPLLFPNGDKVEKAEFLRLAAQADYILIGERHDHPAHHMAQAALLREMAENGNPPLVGLEMLPRGVQKELDSFAAGRLSLEKLPKAVNWEKNWGFDFNLYKPIFEVARQYGLHVYGLNLPSKTVRTFSAKGEDALSPAERKLLPSELVPSPSAQLPELWKTYSMHMRGGQARNAEKTAETSIPPEKPATEATMLADAGFRRFVRVQSLWDSVMAENAMEQKLRSRRPMVVIAGGGHTAFGWGIAHRIRHWDPEASVLLIMPTESPTPEKGEADLFFLAPPLPEKGRLGLQINFKTLDVLRVEPGSPADKAGIKAGDVLLKAGDKEAPNPVDLHLAAAAAKKAGKPLEITVKREGQTLAVPVTLP